MREVLVGKYIARIDDEDWEKVTAYKWRPYVGGDPGRHRTVYAIAHKPMVNGKDQGSVIMHRLILDAPKGVKVDHRDFNGLNNQKSNIRLADNKQSSAYQRPMIDCSSKYKGVALDKRHGTWKSQISYENKTLWIGQFACEICAALAYDDAARQLYKDFALLNFNDTPTKEETNGIGILGYEHIQIGVFNAKGGKGRRFLVHKKCNERSHKP